MSTYTQNLYQIVFSTKYRKPTIEIKSKHRLNLFIKQTISKHKCFPYIVNGTEDHIHIVMDLHPTVALSDLMRNIKLASSSFIKKHNVEYSLKYFPEKV